MASLFNIPQSEINHHQQYAIGLLMRGEQSAELLVREFIMQKEMFWNQSEIAGHKFVLSDAQKIIDEMGSNAIVAFTKHAALGQFIKSQYPGALTDQELATPVAYTIVNGKIVLDVNGVYPGPKVQ